MIDAININGTTIGAPKEAAVASDSAAEEE
jgi:hypothetical protein